MTALILATLIATLVAVRKITKLKHDLNRTQDATRCVQKGTRNDRNNEHEIR